MRVIQFDSYGTPDVLYLAEVDTPTATAGQIRLQVAAVGVNPADFKWRQGMFREIVPLQLPHVVGYDVAGIVDAVGPGVSLFHKGDRVVATVRAGYAEFALADETAVTRLPAGIDFATAASLPCAALTGVQLIEDGVRPRKRQTVLITGVTGAVGRFALHAALALEAHVVAAVRPTYFDEARKLGAHDVIAIGDKNTSDLSFDYVADTVGGTDVARLCRHLSPGGTITTVSTTPIDPTGLSATPTFFSYHMDAARLGQLIDDVATGKIVMPIARRLPFASVCEAHRLLESGGLRGKIILEP
jgi:NADPH:quinone reductase